MTVGYTFKVANINTSPHDIVKVTKGNVLRSNEKISKTHNKEAGIHSLLSDRSSARVV